MMAWCITCGTWLEKENAIAHKKISFAQYLKCKHKKHKCYL